MSGVELTSSIGTVDVENLVLRLPAHGNWVATMDIGWPEAPTEGTAATLRLTRSSGIIDAFAGTVRRANLTPGTQGLSVTIVGGSGLLLAPDIAARHHTAGSTTVPAGLVAAGIAQAAGETLGAGVETALDAYPLTRWTRFKGEAWAALDNLAAVLGVEWRVLADGTLWLGTETWPAVDARAFYWKGDPRDGAVIYVPDGAPYRPGTTIDGARVIECCYRITPGRPVMEARVALPGDPVHVPPLEFYRASYLATVKSQNADLTLNLAASDPRLGDDLRNVPFRLNIPGSKTTVPEGALVCVRFEGGLPNGIYACDTPMDPLATKPFALKDDDVDSGEIGAIIAPPGGGTCTFTYKGVPGQESVTIAGTITGPCHIYAKGRPAPS